MANDPNTIQYVIQEDGFWYVASKDRTPGVPEITVSTKGVANGLSTEYNDGYDFGPDSYDPNSTASIPYTQTSGIQEALYYAYPPIPWYPNSGIMLLAGNFYLSTDIVFDPSKMGGHPRIFSTNKYGAWIWLNYAGAKGFNLDSWTGSASFYDFSMGINQSVGIDSFFSQNISSFNSGAAIHVHNVNFYWYNGGAVNQIFNIANTELFDEYDNTYSMNGAIHNITDVVQVNIRNAIAVDNAYVSSFTNCDSVNFIDGTLPQINITNVGHLNVKNSIFAMLNANPIVSAYGNTGVIDIEGIAVYGGNSNAGLIGAGPNGYTAKKLTVRNVTLVYAPSSSVVYNLLSNPTNVPGSYDLVVEEVDIEGIINMTSATLNNTEYGNSTNGTTAGTVTQKVIKALSNYKKVLFYFNSYENDTTTNQVINFIIAFSTIAGVTANTTGLTVSASTSALTITAPNSTTTYSGVIEVSGY